MGKYDDGIKWLGEPCDEDDIEEAKKMLQAVFYT